MKSLFSSTFFACVIWSSLFCGDLPAQTRDRFRSARLEMVRKYVEAEGVKNPRVLGAMRTVPRHEFLAARSRSKAYLDGAWPIGHRQTISPPYIVAYMTEVIDPEPKDRVLEIGTGSGYQAAVLSGLVDEVYTIEIVEPLGRMAATRLAKLGYENVSAKVGDGYKGWPEHAPFDKIIVTCSPEDVPQPLIDQLKDGGKMIIPLGERYQQVFHLFEKKDGKLVATKLIPTLFVPMTGISDDERKILPDPANPAVINGSFELDENEDGLPDHWHYRRQAQLVESEAPDGEHYLSFETHDPGRLAQVLQGMALDGRQISKLKIRLSVKYEDIRSGPEEHHRPALYVYYYDSTRRPIGASRIGPWLGDSEWKTAAANLTVPPQSREAIVRIGLHGATGTLCVDDIQLSAQPR